MGLGLIIGGLVGAYFAWRWSLPCDAAIDNPMTKPMQQAGRRMLPIFLLLVASGVVWGIVDLFI